MGIRKLVWSTSAPRSMVETYYLFTYNAGVYFQQKIIPDYSLGRFQQKTILKNGTSKKRCTNFLKIEWELDTKILQNTVQNWVVHNNIVHDFLL